MRKIDFSYIFWKTAASLLILVMLLVLTAPVCFLLRQNDYDPFLASKVTAIAGFFLYFLFFWFFIARSDLSNISAKNYLTGEFIAYAVTSAIGTLLAFAFSGSAAPPDFSYLLFPFLPVLGFAYLTGSLLAGIALQIASSFLIIPLLYFFKKKKDPTLQGAKKAQATVHNGSEADPLTVKEEPEEKEDREENPEEEKEDRTDD